MIENVKLTAFVVCIFACSLMAHNNDKPKHCPHLLANSSLVVNIEGKFVNQEKNRTSLSVEWRHHSNTLDTFFVNLYDKPSFKFITAGRYRYMEIGKDNVKRQLGLHHLTENIGKTPLKLDDLELLANGFFKCPDTTKEEQPSPNVFPTSNSMMWWSLVVDTLGTPNKAAMHGAKKHSRYFSISNWQPYAEDKLPTLVHVASDDYSGILWIRSAYSAQALKTDPLLRDKPRVLLPVPKLLAKIAMEGEGKVPLILKLNKQLLSE